jgi:hypothetical protein
MNVLEEIYNKLYEQKNVIVEETGDTLKIDVHVVKKAPIERINIDMIVKRSNKTTLVVPDAHAMPNQDLSRFSSLGNLIAEKQPDHIVLMGDFVTLESLSAWDLGKAGKMEGKRYSEDCKAGISAIDLMMSPVRRLQTRQKKNKEAVYKPRLIYILGNHEDRLERYLATKPELSAHLDIVRDLALEDSGFTDIVPYRGFVELEGVLFTHAVMNAANQAIGGKTALSAISQAVSKSIVIGHLHRLETMNHFRHGADDIIQIVSAGCFFEGAEDYADGGLNAYWRGVLLLTHYKQGRFDIDTFSTERLVELY